MRPLQAVLVALAAMVLVLSSAGARGDISNPGSPRYVNKIMVDFVTPTVAPGDTATFSFSVNNSYDDTNATMTDITVTAEIYMYATQGEAREVNDSFRHPPLINGESLRIVQVIPRIDNYTKVPVTFDIETSRKTPHGTYFSQSAYFLRFNVSFNFEGNSTPIVLKSRGFFTDDQWNRMVWIKDEGTDHARSVLNVSYMHSLGVDGLIPDSSFGLKQPIPKWPLAVLIAACAAVTLMIAYYFVLDHPGKFPRLEKRFYYLRGKLSESRRKLKDRRRK